MAINTFTPFSNIYKVFLSKITDDMYMELDKAQTQDMMAELLESAIPWFEFPKVNLSARDDANFHTSLSNEEINILATYMIVEWIG